MKKIVTGNANELGKEHNQWIMGYGFDDMPTMNKEHLRIKWSNHKNGDKRKESHSVPEHETITILVYGKFLQYIGGNSYAQEKEGDFVYCPAKTEHTWEALEDSMMITVQFKTD